MGEKNKKKENKETSQRLKELHDENDDVEEVLLPCSQLGGRTGGICSHLPGTSGVDLKLDQLPPSPMVRGGGGSYRYDNESRALGNLRQPAAATYDQV